MQDLLRPGSHLHFVGVGGAGMSGLAALMLARGYDVTGCDLQRSDVTDDLVERGLGFDVGHDASHVAEADLVVISSAVPETNPDVVGARQRQVPVLKRAELIGELTRQHRTVAIAGTAGKTTTTAMVTVALTGADLDPTALVGGVVPAFGSGARIGHGPFLVVEADEFDGSFLRFSPWLAVVTNVEADHLDFYGDLAAIEDAFQRFADLVPVSGRLVVCGDDPGAAKLARSSKAPVWTYGLANGLDWQARDVTPNDIGGNDFVAVFQRIVVGRFRLRVPGQHNVRNALAAIAAAHVVGADPVRVAEALSEFGGVRRRFELKGVVNGVSVYDDYAHHPTKVKAMLQAARERQPERLIAVFQPHTYHRTKMLFDDFARAFVDADRVIVSDIYMPSGRELPATDVSSASLVRAMEHPGAEYVGSLDAIVDKLAPELRPGDMVLVMGAGDVTRVADALVRRLQETSSADKGERGERGE